MYIALQTELNVDVIFSADDVALPEGAMEITSTQYLEAREAMAAGAVLSIVDGALVVPELSWYAQRYGVVEGYGEAIGFRESYVPLTDAVAVTSEEKDAALDALNYRGATLSIATGSLVVTERPGPTVEDLRVAKRRDIDAAYERAMQVIKSRYPQSEVDGWPEQVAALEQYDADPQSENIVIDGLASDNGITRSDMAERIRGRRILFLAFYTAMTGRRHLLINQVNAVSDHVENAAAQLAAVDETTLPALAQQYIQGVQ